ncbi:MAG: sulfotransferase family 2 domain-containing protein [Gammaproteobacteria bacterium]|nr:sulfotransferase family 2 domain-containing protein [Gammaproteobacteria bacterium]
MASAPISVPAIGNRRATGAATSITSADGRIELGINRRAGTGSLHRLIARRDSVSRATWVNITPAHRRPLRVALVRHPVDRLVSAFFDMWLDPVTQRAAPIPFSVAPSVRERARLFDAFIDATACALSGPPQLCDGRLMPQVTAIGMRRDFVGRVERFEHEVRTIEELASVRLLPEEPWEHVHINRSGAKRSGFVPSALQRRKVRALYEMDFDAFGYGEALTSSAVA